jgi:hypothetical protein
MDEVKGEPVDQGLDFEDKLIIARYELLVFQSAGVGVNEQASGAIAVDIESKDQHELPIG